MRPDGGSMRVDENTIFDRALVEQPRRFWRMRIFWEPYLLNDAKAYVHKEFQLVVRAEAERVKLEKQITEFGGDAQYLMWFEQQLGHIGVGDRIKSAKISRFKDATVVLLATRSMSDVFRTGDLSVPDLYFPEKLFEHLREGCMTGAVDLVPSGESVGVEVVLESRQENPTVTQWQTIQEVSDDLVVRSWSSPQNNRIAYRKMLSTKRSVVRCPQDIRLRMQLQRFWKTQAMGISW